MNRALSPPSRGIFGHAIASPAVGEGCISEILSRRLACQLFHQEGVLSEEYDSGATWGPWFLCGEQLLGQDGRGRGCRGEHVTPSLKPLLEKLGTALVCAHTARANKLTPAWRLHHHHAPREGILSAPHLLGEAAERTTGSEEGREVGGGGKADACAPALPLLWGGCQRTLHPLQGNSSLGVLRPGQRVWVRRPLPHP